MAVKVGSIYNRLERNNDMDSKDFLQVNCCGIYGFIRKNQYITPLTSALRQATSCHSDHT